ncbi:MAG TPA: autotransporter-associated beta strand repeat-containing protein, partial [Candidatus Paceibacterota bacterium]|nr:autotransporter-associated beta strand repeat-containing protein [Candidatus Paceibacterota bacterium]
CGADSDWNTTSLNWTDTVAGGVIAFSQTNAVRFDNRGAGSPYVNVTQPTVVYKVTADSTADYVLSSAAGNGSLVGQGSITKLNSGRLTIDLTNNLSGPTVISGGTLQVGNYDSLGSLGGGQVTNNATLSFSRADTALNVGNSIHGTGTVSFDGGGTVAISGVNDYTGPTLVNAGIVNLLSSSGLGAATGNTTVGYGAQVYITANVDVPENFVLYGSGPDATSGALRKGGAGFTAITGTVNFPADATIGLDNGATLVLSNTVSGAGPLTVTGGGNLTLAKPNTYNGGTTISAGVVNVNANAGLGTAPATISGTGRFVLGDGVSVANAFVLDSVSPGVGLGSIMVNDNTNGTVTTVSGSVTASVAPANGGMFLGPFSSGYLNVTGPVNNTTTGDVSSRDGFVRFSGGGSYTLFDLKQGTVSIGANNGLSTGASIKVASIGGATFDLNGFNQALTGLADGGVSASEVITNSAASTSTLTLNLSAPNTFSGVIAGKVALVQNGTGSLLLAGTNSYTGDTTINAGTLELAQPSLAAVSTVRIASGAFLQLDFTTTNRVAGLVLNGVSQPFGVYNSTTSPSYITGPGSLEVAAAIASNPTNITFNVSGGNVTISWPASHLGWILQSQTNALSAGLGTNWTDVAGSDSATQKVIAISPANPSVFYRLRRP